MRVHQILTSLYTLFFETGLINGYPYLFPLHGCYKVLLRSSGSIQKTAEVSIVFQLFLPAVFIKNQTSKTWDGSFVYKWDSFQWLVYLVSVCNIDRDYNQKMALSQTIWIYNSKLISVKFHNKPIYHWFPIPIWPQMTSFLSDQVNIFSPSSYQVHSFT